MASNAESVAAKLEDIPTAQLLVGTFVARATNGMVQVDFGQGAVTILTAGFTEPLTGQSVQCLRLSDKTIMLGLAIPRSEIGVVTATGTPRITVTTSAGAQQLPFVTSYSAVVGDNVLLSPGGVVIGKVTAIPAGTYSPPVVAPTAFSVDFRASDSGSYQSGSWNKTDVWASDSNVGAWFYENGSGGTIIADTIADTATITRLQAYLPEFYNAFPAELARIGLHGLASKSGAPSFSSLGSIADGSGWQDLPVALADSLKTGATKGIGVTQSAAATGYHKFTGRASDADSGMLRIDWTV